MRAYYKPFKSIDEIKNRGEHIKKGQILPKWMYKVTPKRLSHCFTSNCNQWAFRMPLGIVLFTENHDGQFDSVIMISRKAVEYANKNTLNLEGKPTHHVGNADSNSDALCEFNKKYLAMALISDGFRDNSIQLQINIQYSATIK